MAALTLPVLFVGTFVRAARRIATPSALRIDLRDLFRDQANFEAIPGALLVMKRDGTEFD
jgi:hypothetical protein